MKNIFNHNIILFLLGFLVYMGSCTKIDDYKTSFTNGKELIYAGRADTLRVHPGRNRAMLSFLLLADPNIKKVKVYWNNKADSVEIDIQRTEGIDTIRHLLNNLNEGSYSFQVFTYDYLGNKSVPSYVTGRVYGNNYENTLLNRELKIAELLPDGRLSITWNSKEENSIGIEVFFTDKQGVDRKVIVSAEEDQGFIADFESKSGFKYRTLFMPDTLAIDTFYSAYATSSFIELLDKRTFKDMSFDGDAQIHPESLYLKSNLWDNNYSTDFDNTYGDYSCLLTTGGDGESPQQISFDLGGVFKLNSLNLRHYYAFVDRAPRRYEIWGAIDPDAPEEEGGWVKLVYHEQVKPSGLPDWEYDSADKEAWEAGDQFSFNESAPPVRYIRIKCLQNWGEPGHWAGKTNFALSEIFIWRNAQ